jgi:hypothetical protein
MNFQRKFLEELTKLGASARGYKTSLLSSTLAFLTLLLSSFLSDVIRNLNPLDNATVWIAIVFFVSSSSLMFLSTERAAHWTQYHYIRSRFRKPVIRVLGSSKISDDDFAKVARCCEFAPRTWAKGLQGQNLSAETLEFSMLRGDYDVLINPFGERYLESNVGNMQTLRQIKQFVQEGGLFVNVGGLAFFYMYNPESEIEGLTGALFEYYIGGVNTQLEYRGTTGAYKPSTVLEKNVYLDAASTRETWLFVNLGCRTTISAQAARKIQAAQDDFADLVTSDSTIQEFRAIERCESLDALLIPIFKSEYQPNYAERMHECYPIAAIRLGLGYFIICGMVVKQEADKTLVQQTVARICDVLSKKGRLEQFV